MSKSPSNELQSFISVAKDHPFPIQNLPYGVFQAKRAPFPQAHIGVAIGDFVLDLTILASLGFFPSLQGVFDQACLNPLMATTPKQWQQVRQKISALLASTNPELRDNPSLRQKVLLPHCEVTMLLPVKIADYTDFYSSREHAVNVGTMFRDKDNPLLPNWLHLPVGYHGRASSVVVSGTPIHRPRGQILPNPPEPQPILAPSRRLDFEVELAGFIGHGNPLGTALTIDDAEAAVFGMVLLNDWSARDIQQWEYVPLGPFLSKSFATTISPWVVTMEALAPFMVEGPSQDPEPLAYLRPKIRRKSHFNIELTVKILSKLGLDPAIICRTNSKNLYWSLAQQIAHHTIAGCNLQSGDLLASGTISGKDPGSYGSLLELSWGGKNPIKINTQEERKFLEDGDRIILEGYCQAPNYRIGFGTAEGLILPSS